MQQSQATRKKSFLFLSFIPCYFIIVGFFLSPISEIISGLIAIIREPDFLITDYFVIGGIGASFVNAGVLSLICLALIYFLKMPFDGHTITSTFLMFGFSLFGKNLLNIWAILFGVWLYAKIHGTPFSRYVYIGLYGTSLSPIITQVFLLTDSPYIPLAVRVALSIACGAFIGFVMPPLATHVHYAHMGYSLYNVGFACGFIAIVVMSLFKSFGIVVQSRLIWFHGQALLLLFVLMGAFLGMLIAALFVSHKKAFHDWLRLLKTSGIGGTDFLQEFGFCVTIFNMAVNGLVSSIALLLVGGDLNGPTIGAIFTIIGFSSTGKHIRNIVPIMIGVWLASFVKTWHIQDPSAQLAFLLSTTLAPISGSFGAIAGIAAGFLHSSVAIHIGIVYAGMNLYNNGFAGGFVAIFMVPVIQSILSRKPRAKEDLSL